MFLPCQHPIVMSQIAEPDPTAVRPDRVACRCLQAACAEQLGCGVGHPRPLDIDPTRGTHHNITNFHFI